MRFDPRVFVIRSPAQMEQVAALLTTHAPRMAEQERYLACRVYEWKAAASDEQRALIWVINQQIADQAKPRGQTFGAEIWHEHLKMQLLPEESAKGTPKWVYLPDGSRVLNMGTEDLDRAEKQAYIDALLAHAATELGVQIRIIDRRFE